jgi:hypothetical protein
MRHSDHCPQSRHVYPSPTIDLLDPHAPLNRFASRRLYIITRPPTSIHRVDAHSIRIHHDDHAIAGLWRAPDLLDLIGIPLNDLLWPTT